MDKATQRWLRLMKAGKRLGCHQKPERSFFFQGKYQYPICARCTGVIVGEIIAIICLFIFRLKWWMILLLLAPMGVDWVLQRINVLPSTNIRRLITGILGGFALTYVYFYVIEFIVKFVIGLF